MVSVRMLSRRHANVSLSASARRRDAGSRYTSSHGAELAARTCRGAKANARVTKKASTGTERVGTRTRFPPAVVKPTSTNYASSSCALTWSVACTAVGGRRRGGRKTRRDRGQVKKIMVFRAWIFGVVVVAAGPLGASERLTLRVSPAVSFAPANLVVRATIEAHSANRAVEVVAESSEFYRSSGIELDGGNAPRPNT